MAEIWACGLCAAGLLLHWRGVGAFLVRRAKEDILKAAKEGDLASVEGLLRLDPTNVEKIGMGRSTALHYAARNGHEAVVAALLRSRAAVDAADRDGETALHRAALNGHEANVAALLRSRAAVDAASNDGRTALHWAATNRHEAIVATLLRSRAAVDAADHRGRTALHWAATNRNEAIVATLLQSRAAVDAADHRGRTPLRVAAGEGHTAALQLWMDARAAVDAADHDGQTPLWRAARNGHAAAVERLLAAGAAEDVKDKEGQTPLDTALQWRNADVVQVLRPVFVSLMSGRAARCNPSHQSVQDLLEEAEKKLEVKISQLLTPDGVLLRKEMTLVEAHLAAGDYVTAIAEVVSEDKTQSEAEAEKEPTEDGATLAPDSTPARDAGRGLHDPRDLIDFLLAADVGLLRFEFLAELQSDDEPLPRRQEAEHRRSRSGRTALVSRDELRELVVDLNGCVTHRGNRVHFISVSHAWETREHPDPHGYQVSAIVDWCRQLDLPGALWIFYDYASLYQYRRTTVQQQESFDGAMLGMHKLYAHEAVEVCILRELTPPDYKRRLRVPVYFEDEDRVVSRPVSDLIHNDTPYEDRGWCKAESEWTRLRTDLRSGVPTPPWLFEDKMKEMKFTHRSDEGAVVNLQRMVFEEKAATTENLMLENLGEEELTILRAALPSYTSLRHLVANNNRLQTGDLLAMLGTGADLQVASCGLGDAEALAMASALTRSPAPAAAGAAARRLCLARNRISAAGLRALRQLQQQRTDLELDLSEQLEDGAASPGAA